MKTEWKRKNNEKIKPRGIEQHKNKKYKKKWEKGGKTVRIQKIGKKISKFLDKRLFFKLV